MNDFITPCIHNLFERQVELSPDQVALIFEGQKLSYAELNEKANQLARFLQENGVKPESLIGICVDRSLEMMIALLAIMKAGGAYVPLDPNYPIERLSFIVEDTGIDLLLTQGHLLDRISSLKCEFFELDNDWQKTSSYQKENVTSNVTAKNLAYIIYTSGSTGTPKGVMIQHDSVVNQLQWIVQYLQLDDTDIVLQQTSISFDVSVLELFEGLISGGKLVIAKPNGQRDNLYIVDLIKLQNITTVHISPTGIQTVMESRGFEQCVSLKRICSAGEALPVSIANDFSNRSNALLFNMYGPTEAAIISTSSLVSRIVNTNSVPIGKPVNNTQIYILDEKSKPVSAGDIGEIYIGGVQVARGYLNRPELTKERFVTGLVYQNSDNTLYKTGDLGRYLADGEIEYLGRVDHQIQLRGNRIEPGEIEASLIQHPDVKNALVVLHENQFLIAYLISDRSIETSEIRAFLTNYLPSSMLPSSFVTLKEFPLTINGKIDRSALPEPHYQRNKMDKNFVAPTNDSENKLSILWAELLKLDDCGVHDSFFEWGGDSLLAVELTHRMEAILNIDLPIMYLFENPTISDILENLHSVVLRDESSSLEKIQVKGYKRPLFFIGTTKYARSLSTVLGVDQPVYGLNIFGVREAVNADLLVTVESIAEQFLSEIYKVQPQGPYQIASYCGDTIIAFEIAQQIIKEGKSVSLFITIDTVWNEDSNNITNTKHLLNRVSYFNFSLVIHRIVNVIEKIQRKFTEVNKSQPNQSIIEKHELFISKFKNARLAYVPKKHTGKIVSFLSQEYSLKYGSTGLNNFIYNEDEHKEYIINGFHDSLFEDAYLLDLAELLKIHLQ